MASLNATYSFPMGLLPASLTLGMTIIHLNWNFQNILCSMFFSFAYSLLISILRSQRCVPLLEMNPSRIESFGKICVPNGH